MTQTRFEQIRLAAIVSHQMSRLGVEKVNGRLPGDPLDIAIVGDGRTDAETISITEEIIGKPLEITMYQHAAPKCRAALRRWAAA